MTAAQLTRARADAARLDSARLEMDSDHAYAAEAAARAATGGDRCTDTRGRGWLGDRVVNRTITAARFTA